MVSILILSVKVNTGYGGGENALFFGLGECHLVEEDLREMRGTALRKISKMGST